MKTLIQSLTVTAATYSLLFVLLTGFMAFSTETGSNPPAVSQEEFNFEEEAYVDDIPFDTESIAELAKFNSSMEVRFEMEDESYIDDIPFDTREIASAVQIDYASLK